MSNIIGEGFESFVDEQVNKRQEILGSINRTTEHCSLNADLMRCKNYDCWEPNGDIVVDGYGKLIKKLATNIKIKLNSEVIKIVQNEQGSRKISAKII